MPSTTTLFFSGMTRNTRPVVRALVVPASSPVMTSTISSFLMFMTSLHHFWGEADDLHVTLFTQLTGNGAEDARAARVVVLLVEEDHRVRVEADRAAVV